MVLSVSVYGRWHSSLLGVCLLKRGKWTWKSYIRWFIVLFSFLIAVCTSRRAPGKTRRKASYNIRLWNISRKRASKLISADSYMCELKRFFSFYFAAYLATKFLILMEVEAVERVWNARCTRQKLCLSFMPPF